MEPSDIRPSRWWYVVSGVLHVIFAIGVAISIVSIFAMVYAAQKHITVPSVSNIELDIPGEYFIFCEHTDRTNTSSINKAFFSLDDFNLVIRDKSFHEAVTVEGVANGDSYESRDRPPVTCIGRFRLAREGTYVLECSYKEPPNDEKVSLIVSRSPMDIVLRPIIFSNLALTFVLLIASGIFWVTLIRRHRMKKRLEAEGIATAQ
jgi:hypothetical protein